MSGGLLAGRTVLVAGATSTSGAAVARALTAAGAAVVAVGSRDDGLEALRASVPLVTTARCDLADRDAVEDLRARIRAGDLPDSSATRGDEPRLQAAAGHVDGLVHLVGGWRGGGGITGRSDEDWAFLERGFRTLRNTTRVFHDDLVASDAGRLAIVSSTSVDAPTAGAADYAAAKAAADAWVRAVAQGFGRHAPTAAAVVFTVRSLSGLEDVLADEVVRLWQSDPAAVNGTRIPLEPRMAQ